MLSEVDTCKTNSTMGKKPKCTREQVIEAIRGTSGIKTVIAKKLGVERQAFDRYLERWQSVREAFEQEKAATSDVARSVLVRNIQLSHKLQTETGKPVDTADAKWYLSRVERDEFATKQETALTNKDGETLVVEFKGNIKPDAL